MRIGEIYGPGKFGLSFEIFPPKTSDGDEALWENVGRLARLRPAFISCTYGAGGTTLEPVATIARLAPGLSTVAASSRGTTTTPSSSARPRGPTAGARRSR